MQNAVEKKFNSFQHLTTNAPILVGVSGGADSIVLAHLLHKNGYKIGIAHCHFNLRGTDADADQEFSKQFAKQLHVPFYTVKFETQTYADTRKISIQMAARKLRYFWFEKICTENGYDQIAVGTHLTDAIETFIFNATKGSGLSGLRGIKSVNNKVVRPLLQVSKQEIYHYAKKEELTWQEDKSNQSIKYHRNKIRHQILPVLEEINPNLEATFQRNFKRLSRVDSFVLSQIETIWNSWITTDGKGFKLPIQLLVAHEYTDVVLQYKLTPLGFNADQITHIIGALTKQPGANFYSKDYAVYIDRIAIFIQPKRFFTIPNQYAITEFMGEITQPISLKFTDKNTENLQFSTNKNRAYFDFDKLKFPLTLRKWKEGDRLHPFGMKGVKKVSDLLIDAKIPLHQKDHIWVMESANEICWVIGIRSSDKFKVDAKSKRAYIIDSL